MNTSRQDADFPEVEKMDNQENSNSGSARSQEPIPGYRLLERIGRGGYGEVWKTLAPGGVPKAIKLIYGDDSARMTTELRAINRVKDVRHPFLLSIERIELSGDMLAIVTELGDKNLQQYFQEFVARQQPGIPQDELLGMLRDVADVLDYIYQEHALQHLDIKPGNLLLFGKRLKVADFGLVKNVFERSASLVHGLTPTYAAPEIFDGQPTRTTDQYSLAILYQEMLTGVLPFNGLTAARLATQHLRESPDVSPLPSPQRSVIARALSKDPQRRFATCMELVEALVAARRQPTAHASSVSHEAPVKRDTVKPATVLSVVAPLSTSTHSKIASDTSQSPPSDTRDRQSVPTIVIGMGGSAGKALQRLRLRIGDRLGGMNSLRAFKTLFFDLDQEALNEINHDQQAWRELEAVSTPLRNSAEYREQGHLHRRWLSRRWLFNVPRNLQTDGLRPFGRLGLLSHANRVLGALKSAIHQVSSTCPGIPPRILFVASISGGTGSGMLPDLAYAVRHELRNAGFPEVTVDAVLLHSTPIGTGRDKAILNAVATLSELQHYSAPTSFYPGEPVLQIPPFHGDNKTFASTQLLHLGNDLDESTFVRTIDNVAEHLFCRLFTNLDQTLGHVRSHTPQRLQTVELVQVHQVGGYASSFVHDLAHQLSVDVIRKWCGSETESDKDTGRTTSIATEVLNALQASDSSRYQELSAQAETRAIACGIDVAPLLARAREMLRHEIVVLPQDYLAAQFDDAVKAHHDSVPDHEIATLVIALQDRAIGLDFGERPANNPRNTLYDVMNPRLTSQAMPIAARFIEWVCDLIDQPTFGVDAARRAAEGGRNCIRDLIGALGKQIQARQGRLTTMRIKLTAPPGPETTSNTNRGWLQRKGNLRANLAGDLTELGLTSFDELLDILVHSQLRAIEASVSIVIDELMNMCQELERLGTRIGKAAHANNSDQGLATDYELRLQKHLLDQRRDLVEELRLQIEQHVLTGPKKLQRYLRQRCSYDHEIGEPLCDHARRVVLKNIKQILCRALGKNSQGDKLEPKIDSVLTGLLQEPWLLAGGHEEHAVMIVPEQVGETAVQNSESSSVPRVTILPAQTNNVAVFRQRRESTIQEAIRSITNGQDQLVDVAANLHTRIDVDWKLPDCCETSAIEIDGPFEAWGEVSQTVKLD